MDDLVVNEEPSVSYAKKDEDKTPSYISGYKAVQTDDSERPAHVDSAIWSECKRIKEEAATKVKDKHYTKGSEKEGFLMLDDNGRLPKVKLSADWLVYLNFTVNGITPDKNTYYMTLCTPYMYTKYSCSAALGLDIWTVCVVAGMARLKVA